MGGVSTGGSKVADAGLNVVPFIDLLVCLICFLVVSAVWASLSTIDVEPVLPRAAAAEPPPAVDKSPIIQVAVTPTGYLVNLTRAGQPDLEVPTAIAAVGQQRVCRGMTVSGSCSGQQETFVRYDRARLGQRLGELMKASRDGARTRVMVASHDGVPFTHLIGAFDTVLQTCEPQGGCLKNLTVGDMGLLRSRGFDG